MHQKKCLEVQWMHILAKKDLKLSKFPPRIPEKGEIKSKVIMSKYNSYCNNETQTLQN